MVRKNDAPEIRLIVAGCRWFSDYQLARDTIDIVLNTLGERFGKRDVCIISGTASGADSLGERYAKERNLRIEKFPPDWNKYQRAAGPIRNEQMAKYAVGDDSVGCLVAFWDGASKGTKSMIDLAQKHGLIIYRKSIKNASECLII